LRKGKGGHFTKKKKVFWWGGGGGWGPWAKEKRIQPLRKDTRKPNHSGEETKNAGSRGKKKRSLKKKAKTVAMGAKNLQQHAKKRKKCPAIRWDPTRPEQELG